MMSVHDWWGSGIHCLTEGWKYIPTHIKLILWWATIQHKKSWEMGFTQIQFLSGNFHWSPWISTMLWEGDLAEVYISFKNIILWLIFILVFEWTGLVQIPTLQHQLHFRKWFISWVKCFTARWGYMRDTIVHQFRLLSLSTCYFPPTSIVAWGDCWKSQ